MPHFHEAFFLLKINNWLFQSINLSWTLHFGFKTCVSTSPLTVIVTVPTTVLLTLIFNHYLFRNFIMHHYLMEMVASIPKMGAITNPIKQVSLIRMFMMAWSVFERIPNSISSYSCFVSIRTFISHFSS
jgi:hypothetical protein